MTLLKKVLLILLLLILNAKSAIPQFQHDTYTQGLGTPTSVKHLIIIVIISVIAAMQDINAIISSVA